jgi:hypothetical protein
MGSATDDSVAHHVKSVPAISNPFVSEHTRPLINGFDKEASRALENPLCGRCSRDSTPPTALSIPCQESEGPSKNKKKGKCLVNLVNGFSGFGVKGFRVLGRGRRTLGTHSPQPRKLCVSCCVCCECVCVCVWVGACGDFGTYSCLVWQAFHPLFTARNSSFIRVYTYIFLKYKSIYISIQNVRSS